MLATGSAVSRPRSHVWRELILGSRERSHHISRRIPPSHRDLLTRTPRALTPVLVRFASTVVPDVTPTFVNISPGTGGEINECFGTVAAHIEQHGGSVQHGWALWEWPGVMIEAEFHAVWRALDNSLLDVTPREDSEQRVLFLPDPTRTFDGSAVDNVRLALTDDPRAADFIRLAEQKYEILNRGRRAHQFGLVGISRDEIEPVLLRMMALQSQLSRAPGRNEACPCGSGGKYKRCHGA